MRPLLRRGYVCTPKGVCCEVGANQGGTAGFPPLRASQGRFLFVIWNTIFTLCQEDLSMCDKGKGKFYITTPIYYPSDKLHLGQT